MLLKERETEKTFCVVISSSSFRSIQLGEGVCAHLETTTTATTLSAGRVGGGRGDVLDAANLHAGTGEGAEGGLGTGAGGLGGVTAGGADLDVQGVDAELLAAGGDVLGGQHGGVGGGLITVGLDLHATGDTGDGFATTVTPPNVSSPSCIAFLCCLRRDC